MKQLKNIHINDEAIEMLLIQKKNYTEIYKNIKTIQKYEKNITTKQCEAERNGK